LTATPFTLGEVLHAEISPAQDTDWYRFHGEAGQTVLVAIDSLASHLDVALRLWCGDSRTRLAYSAPLTVRERVLVGSLPSSGDFFVSVSPHNDSTGVYRLVSGLAAWSGERGRDQRDVFVSYSDDAVHWSAPVRASADPPTFDDWLPEVAVGADGHPYLAWYDWREGDPSGCGAASNVMLARSDDDGATWREVGVVSEIPTLWSAVGSNLVPNMGDYIALLATDTGIQPAWADGRGGDPDVYAASWPFPETARAIQPMASVIQPDGVLVRWAAPPDVPMVGTAYRRVSGGQDVAFGEVASEASGSIELFDADVAPGYRYHYQLGVRTSAGEVMVAPQAVDIPDQSLIGLAIEQLRPNPSDGGFHVQFRRPDLGAARLEVLDISGRRRWSIQLGPEYGARGTVDVGRQVQLDAGLYVVRLVQGGETVSRKAVVVR